MTENQTIILWQAWINNTLFLISKERDVFFVNGSSLIKAIPCLNNGVKAFRIPKTSKRIGAATLNKKSEKVLVII